jgi:DNA invertase Pin-like site-specific DNA recombinase
MKRLRRKATTFGYLRVSSDRQNAEIQKLAILNYCNAHKINVDEWVEVVMSTTKSQIQRRIKELLEMLHPGDTLIVSELSRLARSLLELLDMIETIKNKEVRLIAIKEGIDLLPGKDVPIATKITISMFALLSEVSRDLMALRSMEGQQLAKSKGKHIGRPPGSTGKSKLDKHRDTIENLLGWGLPKTQIAKMVGCTPPTLYTYIQKRNIQGSSNPTNPLIGRQQ